ncbi:MAG: hypothetical protein ABGZ35_33390 [Planctomycetaceae bacterium]|jgi:hypothetical protein
MFARTVALLLIAEIVACPLSCSADVCRCCYDDSSSQRELGTRSCCELGAEESCCGKESSRSQDNRQPEPEPGTLICQGVCGGAVLNRPSELDSTELSFLLPRAGNDSANVSLFTRYRTGSFGYSHPVGKGNQGRFVRTLNMSFLC